MRVVGSSARAKCPAGWISWSLLSLVLASCGPEPVGSTPSALDPTEEAALYEAFYESAFYCEAALLDAPLSAARARELGDAALERLPAWRGDRRSLVAGPHQGPLPTRNRDSRSNACEFPVSVELGGFERLSLEDGFCRADFNYCLGKELELHARAVTGERSPEAGAAMLRRARERLQAAAVEYVSSFAFYGTRCPLASHTGECLRLDSGYAEVARGRLLDAIAATDDIARAEMEQLVALGDDTSSVEGLEADAIVSRLWGPGGYRLRAMERAFGPADGVELDATPTTRRWSDAPLPSAVPRDDRGSLALNLMSRHRVPLTFVRDLTADPPLPIQVAAAWDSPEYIAAVTSLLDHRMAAAEYLEPYASNTDPAARALREHVPLDAEALFAFAARPLPPHQSLLETRFQLGEDDVAMAMRLAADAYEVFDAPLVLYSQVQVGTASIDSADVGQSPGRSAVRIEAATADVTFDGAVDVREPAVALVGRDGAPTVDNAYDLSLDRVDGSRSGPRILEDPPAELGAAAVLHLLRVHLLRLARVDDLDFLDSGTLTEGVALLDAVLGDAWFEADRYSNLDCGCLSTGPFGEPICFPPPYVWVEPYADGYLCRAERSRRDWLTWRVHYPPGAEAWEGGEAVFVRSWDGVQCLVNDRHPGTREPCLWEPNPMVEVGVADPVDTIGRSARGFRVDDVDAFPATGPSSRVYVLWRSPDGSYRLADIIKPARGGNIHTGSGTLRAAGAGIWAGLPSRPAKPALVGAAHSVADVVPPLESELTSDSDAFEDSFRGYLAEARAAAHRAGQLLTEARDGELMSLQDEASDAARLEEAALAETEVLSDLCGARADCDPPRIEPMTLLELGLVPDRPTPAIPSELGLTDIDECRELTDELFAFFEYPDESGVEDPLYGQYVTSYLKTILSCSVHFLRRDVGEVELTRLPEAVATELAADGAGDFSAFQGRLREELVVIFQALSELRALFDRIEAERLAADAIIRGSSAKITRASLTDREITLCRFRSVNAFIEDVASIVASVGSIATSGGGGGESGGGGGGESGSSGSDGYSAAGDAGAIADDVASIGGSIESLATSGGCNNQAAGRNAADDALQAVAQALQNLHALAFRARGFAFAAFNGLARLDELNAVADRTAARRAVTERLIETDDLSDLAAWRSLQAFRWRRASASLERAMRAAHVARRAIEFRLGVDLGQMAAPEPFVPAPRSWADDIYAIPMATTGPEGTEVSTSAERIVDYVQNLEDFVAGYPFARRFRDSTDLQVLDLRALLQVDETESIHRYLRYRCGASDEWVVFDDLDPVVDPRPHPCVGRGGVREAALVFTMPPRLTGYLAERLAADGFNHRHESMAFNLVGTGVLDCERATFVDECYTGANVPFTLRQEGNAIVEGFDGEILSFAIEPGVIRTARALAAERELTNPLSGIDRSLIGAYQRFELRGRPLSGTYSLTLPGRPEVRWDRLESVQLILGYRYWTRQL